MVNTILSGLLNVSMTVVNWFLTPIYNILQNVNIGNVSFTDALSSFNDFVDTACTSLAWVADATGIPKPLFTLMFGVFGGCIMMRIQVYILKLVLKWWDRIIA